MNTVDVMLECGHLALEKMRVDKLIAVRTDTRYCLYHGWQLIVGYHYQEYHTRCEYPGCRFSRWTGQNKAKAKRLQSRHASNNPDHALYVGMVYDRVTKDGKGSMFCSKRGTRLQPEFEQGTLSVEEKPPPF